MKELDNHKKDLIAYKTTFIKDHAPSSIDDFM